MAPVNVILSHYWIIIMDVLICKWYINDEIGQGEANLNYFIYCWVVYY